MQTTIFDDIVPHFHNTIGASKKELIVLDEKCKTQEDKVLDYFKKNPELHCSPTDVWSAIGLYETPVTSIRRAMSNLTRDGFLEKTNVKVNGIYGVKTFCWKLKQY